MKLAVILNIVFFLFLPNSFLAALHESNSSVPEGKIELRKILEEIEKSGNVKFIYSDNLVTGKFVDPFTGKDVSEKNIRALLKQAELTCKLFGENTFVLYKDIIKEKPRKLYEKVITNEEFLEKDSSSVILKPILLFHPDPQYPIEAVSRNLEGRVKVKFKVDTKGNVVKSYVIETSGAELLDSVSKDYVYNLKYSPARVNGVKYDVWVTMIFDYVLSDSVYKK